MKHQWRQLLWLMSCSFVVHIFRMAVGMILFHWLMLGIQTCHCTKRFSVPGSLIYNVTIWYIHLGMVLLAIFIYEQK